MDPRDVNLGRVISFSAFSVCHMFDGDEPFWPFCGDCSYGHQDVVFSFWNDKAGMYSVMFVLCCWSQLDVFHLFGCVEKLFPCCFGNFDRFLHVVFEYIGFLSAAVCDDNVTWLCVSVIFQFDVSCVEVVIGVHGNDLSHPVVVGMFEV